ncbi:MAG: hypothetical protein A2X82_13420 [Geobacteraceae bacterium GWC2_55_20]|nr:MAG: hypothetical protein A2X82_13420 [Geobacteraceae bacterium GWC2_55_20]OGU25539.1 MAG: hypothetical protein A2X85_15215 [Geobacteraceae bacterium GWF2_54_21]HBA72163.1 hypothetical protein [Geobacter sp.]HCE68042.1 hypothetical protein [Geobacter sp.]
MDISSVAGSSLLYRAEQTQQAVSTSMMKQAAEQQNQVANLLAQNAQQAPQPASKSGNSFSFSTYA